MHAAMVGEESPKTEQLALHLQLHFALQFLDFRHLVGSSVFPYYRLPFVHPVTRKWQATLLYTLFKSG